MEFLYFSFFSQYVDFFKFLLLFKFKKSFLTILANIAKGVTTIKKIKDIITGEIILLNTIPNLNHKIFNGVSIVDFSKPKIKKRTEIDIKIKFTF